MENSSAHLWVFFWVTAESASLSILPARGVSSMRGCQSWA